MNLLRCVNTSLILQPIILQLINWLLYLDDQKNIYHATRLCTQLNVVLNNYAYPLHVILEQSFKGDLACVNDEIKVPWGIQMLTKAWVTLTRLSFLTES